MPLRYGWLQAPLTASSTTKVLNLPQRARPRVFLVCILVSAAFAQPGLELHFVTRPKDAGCDYLSLHQYLAPSLAGWRQFIKKVLRDSAKRSSPDRLLP